MTRVTLIAQTARGANTVESTKLALGKPGEPILEVKRVRHYECGRPLAFEEVILPLSHYPGLDRNGDVTVNLPELAQQYGLVLGRATERVSTVLASDGVAVHLGVTAGTPILKLDRLTATADGAPIEWRVSFANPREKNQL